MATYRDFVFREFRESARSRASSVTNDSSSTLTDSEFIDAEDPMAQLKREMQDAWAERERIDSKKEVKTISPEFTEVVTGNTGLGCRVEELEVVPSTITVPKADLDALQQKYDELLNVTENQLELVVKELCSKYEEQTLLARAEKQEELMDAYQEKTALKSQNEEMRIELDNIKMQLEQLTVRYTAQSEENHVLLLASKRERINAQSSNVNAKLDAMATDISNLVLGQEKDGKKLQQVMDEKENLERKYASLKTENDRLVQELHKCQNENVDYEDELDSLRGNIRILNIERDSHQAEHLRLESEKKKTDAELQGRVTRLQFDMLEDENKRLKSEISTLTTEIINCSGIRVEFDTLQDANHKLRSEVTTLTTKLANCRTENADHKSEVSALKYHIACCIADLDICCNEDYVRVFTCHHDHLSHVPDGNHSTREKAYGVLAWDLYGELRWDADFMKDYMNARQYILDHHRAHERVKQGRANYAWYIKKLCMYHQDLSIMPFY
jgi:chromosome segregation ATPase